MTPVRTLRDRILSSHMLPVCAAVAVAVPFVSGCSGGGKANSAPPTPPSITSTTAAPTPDRTAEAETAAAAAYVHMWDATVHAYQTGSLASPDLQKYAIDKALSNIKVTGAYYQDHGTVMQGKPVLSPHVTSVDFTQTPYTANITDCMDTTHYIEVSKTTGKAVPRPKTNFHHVTTAVARYNGQAWVISEVTIERDRTC